MYPRDGDCTLIMAAPGSHSYENKQVVTRAIPPIHCAQLPHFSFATLTLFSFWICPQPAVGAAEFTASVVGAHTCA